jgi:hypothetical protein
MFGQYRIDRITSESSIINRIANQAVAGRVMFAESLARNSAWQIR